MDRGGIEYLRIIVVGLKAMVLLLCGERDVFITVFSLAFLCTHRVRFCRVCAFK